MRRLFYIATLVLVLALVPVSAQTRGGGHGSFGGHTGFAGHAGFGGHLGGGHVFGGVSSGRGFSGSRFRSRGFSHGPTFDQPNFNREGRFRGDRFRGDRFHRHHFRNFEFGNCFGCGGWGGWPWWYAGYYDPYWYWDSHSAYDEDREREIQLAEQMNRESLEEQRMRRQEDQDLYSRSEAAPQTRAETPAAPGPATVLVFRDQHRLEVQNYAIVGQTLWNFAPQRTQKIPLAELDLPATTKANDERGVDFRVPAMGEGQ